MQTDETVRRVAERWQSHLQPVSQMVVDAIMDRVPELAVTPVAETVQVTSEANLATLVGQMARGTPIHPGTPTAEVSALTIEAARQAVPFTDIMRAYNVGAEQIVRMWSIEVDRQIESRKTAMEAIRAGTQFVLQWLLALTDGVADVYHAEIQRLGHDHAFARLKNVKDALDDPDLDEHETSSRLGYGLGGTHVALVLALDHRSTTRPPAPRSPEVQPSSILDDALGRLGLPRRPGGALHVRVDLHTMWTWVPASTDALDHLDAVVDPVHVGVGTPGKGLAGFRRSHAEAAEAVRISTTRGRPKGRITRFVDVDIASLCTQDVTKGRGFILGELGPLAARTPEMEELRHTLLTYFSCRSNARAAASRLFVHHNTVRNRLERAEAYLGHPVHQRRLALELALHLDLALNDPAAA